MFFFSRKQGNLIAKGIPVILYARQSEEVKASFENNSFVNAIQGDYKDIIPLKEGLKGHTRLFLLIADVYNMIPLKKTIAAWVYDAASIGVKHYESEQAIYHLPNCGAFVALRPDRFMSNIFLYDGLQSSNDIIFDTVDADKLQGRVSPNDIGAVATVALSEDIEKHGDLVYEHISDVATSTQRAAYLSRILVREIKYKQINSLEKYEIFMNIAHFNHPFAYCLSTALVSYDVRNPTITDVIHVLLRRKPETLEKYLEDNKHLFK
ncbi:hypothetical protein G6F70_001132 [Rhizopus microsporus]|nr:hypothetical protein G6F71_001109 [Rhizopus microsporus]KAG1203756.1 hypothetical protein G6F70_001132 [Rhizopus microsporus]KAG1216421.1 hypothetical protein G6F69_000183 [Rhizopus microsporus]KAG1237710.1 hypothetical protein G6F67_001028 [Rhizopus microsporus]KAG1267563.1 hypothetical protein G6F68_001845 [Rhizopus microsporus]